MANAKITYQVYHGVLPSDVFKNVLELYTDIFEDADIYFFKKRFEEQHDFISVLAYKTKNLVGFKIGYRYSTSTFYSWIGGVSKHYRTQGIGSHLAERQEDSVKSDGYAKIRTKSMNKFKPMILLNIKSGFDIKQVYTKSKGQEKIVFEKQL